MTAFRAVVLKHFRHPLNRGPLPDAHASVEGANPLCGDRIRVEVRIDNEIVADARFTADACILCVASASVLTEHIRGLTVRDAKLVDIDWLHTSLEGEPPPGRRRCVLLPLETVQRALAQARSAAP